MIFRTSIMSDFDRKDLISLAKMCLDLGLYNDSIDYMMLVIKMSTPLNKDERLILFRSYINMKKNLDSIRLKLLDKENVNESLRSQLLNKINMKHDKICDDSIGLIDSYWVKRDKNLESVVDYNHFKVTQHYSKLFFSYHFRKGDNEDVRKAIDAFEKASKIAEEFLKPNDVVRLRIARYFSEIYGDILDSPDKATSIAKETYEKAVHVINDDFEIAKNDNLCELRENMARWSSKKKLSN